MDIAVIIRLVAAISWFIAFSLVVLNATRGSQAQSTRGFGIMIIGMVVISMVLTIAGVGVIFVKPSYRGVVISPLKPEGYTIEPGLHWVVPFAETVTMYNISRRTYTMSSSKTEGAKSGDDSVPALTKDRQAVKIDASVIYSLDPKQVANINILWQSRFEENVVRPISRAAILDAVSQYSAEELISGKRFELEKNISDTLKQKFNNQSLILSEFVLRDMTFSPEYAAAIEQKQIAEQKALQAKLLVEQKRQEAEQARQVAEGQADARIIQAQAEAKALSLVAQMIKENPNLLTYEYISKLSPNIQVMLVPSNAPYILPQLPTPQLPTPQPTATVTPTPP